MNHALISEVAKQHCEGDEKRAREFIKAHRPILESLQNILKNKEEALQVPSKVDYDCPSWACKQADAIGARRTLLEIGSLLEVR